MPFRAWYGRFLRFFGHRLFRFLLRLRGFLDGRNFPGGNFLRGPGLGGQYLLDKLGQMAPLRHAFLPIVAFGCYVAFTQQVRYFEVFKDSLTLIGKDDANRGHESSFRTTSFS